MPTCSVHRRSRTGRLLPRLIEGEAVVISRSPLSRPPAAKAEAEPARSAATLPPVPPRLAAPSRPAPAGLLFSAPPRGAPAAAPHGSLGILRPANNNGKPAAKLALLCGGAAAAAAVFGLALSAAHAERDASPIQLSDIAAQLHPRGRSDMLAVQGRITNLSASPAPIPEMRIALSDAGGARGKMLAAAGTELAPGTSLRFYSFVAVPAGTMGQVSIEIMDKERLR